MEKTYFAMKMNYKTGLCFGAAAFDSLDGARAYAKANGWNRIALRVNGKFYCDCKL